MLAHLATLSVLSIPLASMGFGQVFVPTSQVRSVEAFASVNFSPGVTDSMTAPGFGPFIESVSAQETGANVDAMASATQDSSFTADGFSAQGLINSTVQNSFSDASSTSRFAIEFTLAQPAIYTLSGQIEAFDFGSSSVLFLSPDLSFFYSQSAIGFAETKPLSLSGYLPSGTYSFEVSAVGTVQDGFPVEFASANFNVDLSFAAVTAADCVPQPNSTGQASLLTTSGSVSISEIFTPLSLRANRLPPGQFGLFFYGDLQPSVPFGDGVLCAGPALFRFPNTLVITASGMVSQEVPYSAPPLSSGPGAVQAGSTWTFQLWHRDTGAMSAGWNTSSAATIQFAP